MEIGKIVSWEVGSLSLHVPVFRGIGGTDLRFGLPVISVSLSAGGRRWKRSA